MTKTFSLATFFLCTVVFLSSALAAEPAPDLLWECSFLHDTKEVKPTGPDVQVFEEMQTFAEKFQQQYDLSPYSDPPREALVELETIYLPRLQSPAFLNEMKLLLANYYIGFNDEEEAERLIKSVIDAPNVDTQSLANAVQASFANSPDVARNSERAQTVLERSDLTPGQRFYFLSYLARKAGTEEQLRRFTEMERDYPDQKACLAVEMEQAALDADDDNPQYSVELLEKINKIYPAFFHTARPVTNCMFLCGKAGKTDLAFEVATNFVEAYPNHPDSLNVLYTLGHMYSEAENYEKAAEYYKKVIDFPVKNVENYESLSDTAKKNYTIAYGKLHKIGALSYDDLQLLEQSLPEKAN